MPLAPLPPRNYARGRDSLYSARIQATLAVLNCARLMLCLRALQGQIGQLLAAACVSGCAGFGLRYAYSCARSEATRDYVANRAHI